jgi:hypothetical protein
MPQNLPRWLIRCTAIRGRVHQVVNVQVAVLGSYHRGGIGVIDDQSLGTKACECYRYISKQYGNLYDDLPRSRAQRQQLVARTRSMRRRV